MKKLHTMVEDYNGWHLTHSDLEEKRTPTAFETIDSLDLEINVVVGEFDLRYFHNCALYIKSKCKNVFHKTISNTGHMVNMEKPEEFNSFLFSQLDRS